MSGGFLLSLFPLEGHSTSFARLTCLAIQDSAQGECSSRLVMREELFASLLTTSLISEAQEILAELDERRIVQRIITLDDARALHVKPTLN